MNVPLARALRSLEGLATGDAFGELHFSIPDLYARTVVPDGPWPWTDDMIAVLLHKPDVWLELHGWSPKYLGDSLKHEITRRLKHKVMFGADYPLFTYERLIRDWRSEGYAEDVLADVFFNNAERFLEQVKRA